MTLRLKLGSLRRGVAISNCPALGMIDFCVMSKFCYTYKFKTQQVYFFFFNWRNIFFARVKMNSKKKTSQLGEVFI